MGLYFDSLSIVFLFFLVGKIGEESRNEQWWVGKKKEKGFHFINGEEKEQNDTNFTINLLFSP